MKECGILMTQQLLLLNGPNINMLGNRETDIYGKGTLHDIEEKLTKLANSYAHKIYSFQSNHEGDLIDQLHKADGKYTGIIFNPGAYAHTSIALHDAIKAISTPVIEVHISNVLQREEFRHTSVTAPACKGQIVGLGIRSYELALLAFTYENL